MEEEGIKGATRLTERKLELEEEAEADERVRRTSLDLRREIIDIGGIQNLIELRKKRKERKIKRAKVAAPELRPQPEGITGPVDAETFLKAAVEGKIKIIQKFLEDGGSSDTCDEFKRTALHRASLEGHVDILQKLLDSRASINFTDRLLSTPLHVATRTGHADIVEHLIAAGVDVNAKDREGDTALHDAVRLNRYKIIKMLIICGANMMARNADGKTPTELVQEWQADTRKALKGKNPNGVANHT
ncbi:ankyrin repeat domain-containing protein 2 isoform X2 [Rhinatrema bivittatum]|uniref:ankyrin repeat domain-containing protein 2 isoform X2 n=1 Tax=Rhinatrema bivittatum TaxID=194408 RepID=UPI00112CA67C|nr:ankyrin repeat domain-containing protein 2 isoform X2 [Rhinatrema bivittatum]